MAVIRDIAPDHLIYSQWLTAIAFLGALCCAVLGIKIKWFRANLSFDSADKEPVVASVQSVYRPFTVDVYSPSYRESDPAPSTSSTPAKPLSQKDGSNSNTNKGKPTSQDKNSKPSGSNNKATASATNKPGTSTSSEKKDGKKPVVVKDDKKGKNDDKNKKVDKTVDKNSKKEEEKNKKLALKKEKEEKAKQEKLLKERQQKEKKEREALLKKEKDLKAKEKKMKKDQSQPVASVTIDAEAVASQGKSQTNLTSNIESAKNKQIKNTKANNPMSAAKSVTIEESSEFSSSWDMIAAHRQNLDREPKAPQGATNLRSMANQKKNEPNKGGHLFAPSKNSPRNNANKVQSEPLRRLSTSENESDTEA